MSSDLRIREARRIADERNGRCVSEICPDEISKLILECEVKHQYAIRFLTLRFEGFQCPLCSRRPLIRT